MVSLIDRRRVIAANPLAHIQLVRVAHGDDDEDDCSNDDDQKNVLCCHHTKSY